MRNECQNVIAKMRGARVCIEIEGTAINYQLRIIIHTNKLLTESVTKSAQYNIHNCKFTA